ncbi:flagellar hook-length control protein FliK [Bacillus sp. FJAT-22090]|uniref:flagellar hook-length control protein FliK n=1 Tax=Bacillus sp. FJAT-22090 TaxID=1581038 RepID=UPI0011A92135|nr:flagellar hook-length control protein FliK [Bacillus sp. FJAT-22090]
MNIATLVNMGNNITLQSKGQELPIESNQIFGNVFGQILSNQQIQQPNEVIVNMKDQNIIGDLQAILESSTLEELETLLGSNDLAVKPKELKELLGKLLGEDSDPNDMDDSNVWDLLAGINEQASKLTDTIIQSLNGQGSVNPLEAKEAVQLLKVVQLIGKKSDLTFKQESTLFDVEQLIEGIKEMVSKDLATEENVQLIPNNTKTLTLEQAMRPVVQQVIIKQMATSTEKVIDTKEVTTNIQSQSPTIVQTKVETVSVTLPNEKPAQSEELMKELQKAMSRVQFGQAGGANRLVVKLYPEHLGTIRIELIQKDGMLTTKMLASTALGKELLDSHSHQLKQGLVSQNIQLDKLEITQALQDTSRQERNQSFQESFRQHQQEQQETNKEEKEEISNFEDFLKEMEV